MFEDINSTCTSNSWSIKRAPKIATFLTKGKKVAKGRSSKTSKTKKSISMISVSHSPVK